MADVRARLVPRWVLPAAVAFLLVGFVPGTAAGIAQLVLGLVTFGRIAYRIGGMTDAEWESGPAAVAPSSGRPATAPAVA